MLPRYEANADYYGHVARGYDRMAETYDRVEGRNEISERVRATALAAALDAFEPGDRVLELGCGTGRDALALARHGVNVVATDVSPGMVQMTAARASRETLPGSVTALTMPASEAAEIDGPFDGAYSNGAVLNLEPDITRLARGLAHGLRPGGLAVLTAANRLSFFELAVYPVALRPRKAFRKLGGSVPIPISREGFGRGYAVPTRFLTPKEFRRAMGDGFEVQDLRGLQLITPPWNFVNLARRFNGVVDPLVHIEDRVGAWPGFRSLGAIYLYVLRRAPG